MGSVAKESFGPGIPRADDAIERFADDRIIGRLDDGRQERLGLLRPPARGDVAEDEDRPEHRATLATNGCCTVVDGPFRPVPGDEEGVVRQPHDRALSQGPEGWVLNWLARSFVDDVEDLEQWPPD